MQPFTMKKKLISLTLVSLLAACGGGGGGGGDDLIIGSGSGGSSGGTDGGTDGGTATPAESLALGTGTGGTFTQGAMATASPSISAQGQTTVSVNVVDLASDSALATSSVVVSFTSTCAESGNANITSSVTVTDGLAQAVYTDINCASSDIITASITSGGTTVATATASLDVASLTLGAISFVSADPTTIALANLSGGSLQSYSTIIFRIVDESGNPISGQDVTFDVPLLESMGGATFSPATDTSDGNGLVSTTFNSGTVKTTAAVIATVDGTSLTTSSATISISTGVAIQSTLTLGAEEPNLASAGDENGITTTVTVRVSDFYQNPVPDGGKVSFFTSGGQIDPDCTLSNGTGSCTVEWRSQLPRPDNGRVVIMATLKGEQTQVDDFNADGLFDIGVDTTENIGEAFLDENRNGICDFDETTYLDANQNGTCDPALPSAKYKGIRCADSEDCSGLVDIFKNISIVMSTRDMIIKIKDQDVSVDTVSISSGINFLEFEIVDINGNYPGAGTVIDADFTAAVGDLDTADNDAETVLANGDVSSSLIYPVTITGDGNGSQGALKVTATYPDGSITKRTFIVQD